MDKDILLFSLMATGIVYMFITYTKEYFYKIKLKLKIKSTRESIIDVTIIKKYYWEGVSYSSGSKIFGSSPKLLDSYIIDCYDNNIKYTINDKDIFEIYDIGDTIQLKLIEKLDKHNQVISYRVANLTT